MGYRGQAGGGSRSGQKFQRTQHDTKVKRKEQKAKSKNKLALEEPREFSTEELAEKTANGLSKLGTQIFALSPFSQYFDDWLVSLRQVIAEFESGPTVAADEAFAKERQQVFTDLERALAEIRLKEEKLEQNAGNLAETNHHMVDADAEYAKQTRELATKRNSDIARLTENLQDSERELEKLKQVKTGLFTFTKKAKAKKTAQIEANQKHIAAKAELEVAVQNFDVEQEKLHDDYEKKKQELMEKARGLEKEIANIESDSSVEVRQTTCNKLADAVKASLHRKPGTEKQ
ncbi:MAG TPA: hypothetical protein VMD05_04070 [Candidatus Nanoarchaeia archaeon]|nr:hypothetical protein [Candidatus Nanoarchaeia archaeon]